MITPDLRWNRIGYNVYIMNFPRFLIAIILRCSLYCFTVHVAYLETARLVILQYKVSILANNFFVMQHCDRTCVTEAARKRLCDRSCTKQTV